MTAERWLETVWPVVAEWLPAPPAQVVEVGCGPLGGFVPMLRSAGYGAVGVDPEAPEGEDYRRIAFERFDPVAAADAVVASASLHHVRDPEEVIDRVARMLVSHGTLIVVEWDWEAFDEPTARWCFERLGPDESWLHRRRAEWSASGQPWDVYLRDWAGDERLHTADTLLRVLDERFRRRHLARRPYYFPNLDHTTENDELRAIEAEKVRAARIDYVGRRR